MRTIVAREHARAAAERREAREAFRHARDVTPSRGGWDPRPARPRKPSAAEIARAERAEQARQDWTRRNPQVARAERAIRKELAVQQERFGHKARRGTVATHAAAERRSQGALTRLYASGAISIHELVAAVEIATTAERIGRDAAIKTASLETRIDSGTRGDAKLVEKLAHVRREMAYTQWRRAMGADFPTVMRTIVDDVALTVVARERGMHLRRAKALLIVALDRWAVIIGRVAREVDEGDLRSAEARLN